MRRPPSITMSWHLRMKRPGSWRCSRSSNEVATATSRPISPGVMSSRNFGTVAIPFLPTCPGKKAGGFDSNDLNPQRNSDLWNSSQKRPYPAPMSTRVEPPGREPRCLVMAFLTRSTFGLTTCSRRAASVSAVEVGCPELDGRGGCIVFCEGLRTRAGIDKQGPQLLHSS